MKGERDADRQMYRPWDQISTNIQVFKVWKTMFEESWLDGQTSICQCQVRKGTNLDS